MENQVEGFVGGWLRELRSGARPLCHRCGKRPAAEPGPMGDTKGLCDPCEDFYMQVELDAYWHFDDVEQGED